MTFIQRVLLCILAPLLLILVSGCASPAGLAPPAEYETTVKAVLAYEKALQVNPDDAHACMWLGFIRLDQGEMEKGKNLLSNAVLHDPSLTEAFLKLGKLAEEENKSKDALRFYQGAIDGNPTLKAVIENKYALERTRRTAMSRLDNANALLVEGEFTEALAILNSTLDELPAEPRLHQLLARAYVGLAKTKLAYAERKDLFAKASSALNEAANLGASNGISSIKAEVAHLRSADEDEVAEARELVEAGGGTFSRRVCLGQKAPLLEIRNRSTSRLTLDLKFANSAKQWVVSGNNVSLRSGPGSEFDRIGRLPKGTVAWIRQMPEGEYWNVVTPIGEGWLSSRLLNRSVFVKLTIPSGQTREIILSPGTGEYRLGRGIKSLAEGRERFMPYLCYSWP